MSGPAKPMQFASDGGGDEAVALEEPLLPFSEQQHHHEAGVVADSFETPSAVAVEDDDAANINPIEETWEHGETQPAKYQDPFFAVIFLLQFAVVLVLAGFGFHELIAGKYGEIDIDLHLWFWHYSTNSDSADDFEDVDATRYILFHALVAATSIGWGFLALLLYSRFARIMVQVSLVISPIMFFSLAVWSFLELGAIAAAVFAVSGLFGAFYTYWVWHRIPFAVANLTTAMAPVRSNMGLALLSFWTVVKTLLWTFACVMAFLYLYQYKGCHDDCDHDDGKLGLWFYALLLSYFWTYGVLKYMLHMNVAGVVGSWWFVPEEASACCSQALMDSIYRTSVYSFGSICFGALIISVTQVVHYVVAQARRDHERNRRDDADLGISLLFCLLECLVGQLERLVEYVNEWAFVYAGLYGFDYLTAGSKVYQLFRARGWSVILNDVLVSRGLFIMTVLIAVCTGISSTVLYTLLPTWWDGDVYPASTHGNDDGWLETSFATTFALGCVYGLILSSMLLKVVSSAVDTVVVCFAENPNALRDNHPEHSRVMLRSWRVVYPDECGF